MKSQEEKIKIKKFYEIAESFIKAKDVKSAALVIHDKMGPKLYDISLDIYYDPHEPIADELLSEEDFIEHKQLKSLIIRVNKALNKESIDNFESNEDVKESEVNSSDKEWFSDSII